MVNTMEDLRREVASRLRNALHGREIDMMESVRPELPHMLGITPLNKVHDPNNEKMTLLDTNHQFWQNYKEDVRTKNRVTEKIETAIRSLKEDNIFRMNYPYGAEADVIYVEVDKLSTTDNSMKTSCKECGATLTAVPNLLQHGNSYNLKFSIDCTECGFSGSFERRLLRK